MLDRFGKRFALLLAGFVVLACSANVQASVLAHWLFDENGGTTVNDSSGNNYHGTVFYLDDTTANAGQYEGGQGWTVGGFNFGAHPLGNNVNGGAVVETTLPLNTLAARSYTLELVATHNADHMDAWSPFFSTNVGCCYGFYKTYGQNTLHINLGGQGADYSVPVPITDGNPHHLALVIDNVKKTAAMYFDHQLVGLRGNMGDIDQAYFVNDKLTLGGAKGWTAYERWDGFAYEAKITVDEVLTPDDFIAVPDPILPPAATGSSWEYTNFADPSGLRFRGSAGPITGGKARLTSETLGGQSGQIWRHGAVKFANDLSFSTSFSFEVSRSTTDTPADGMTFMIQDLSSNAMGWGGGQMGIPVGGEYGAPTATYVTVEMDTYPYGVHDTGTLAGQHLAIDVSSQTNSLVEFTEFQDPWEPLGFINTGVRYMWVDYDGSTRTMNVYYAGDNNKPGTPILSYTFAEGQSLADLFGNKTNLYVGFTGATGGLYENNDLLSWAFETIPDAIEPPPGDADRDGDVDKADAAILAAHWLTGGASWTDGDFNDDGNVDDLDLAILSANWGTGVPAGAAVPEPSVLALLAGLGLLVALRRLRK